MSVTPHAHHRVCVIWLQQILLAVFWQKKFPPVNPAPARQAEIQQTSLADIPLHFPVLALLYHLFLRFPLFSHAHSLRTKSQNNSL